MESTQYALTNVGESLLQLATEWTPEEILAAFAPISVIGAIT